MKLIKRIKCPVCNFEKILSIYKLPYRDPKIKKSKGTKDYSSKNSRRKKSQGWRGENKGVGKEIG